MSGAFPARRLAGYQLWRVQLGFEPTDWKSLTTVGPGVREIRIRADGAYRVLYVARLVEAVYVLHGFRKATRKTAPGDIDVAKGRLSQLMAERRKGAR